MKTIAIDIRLIGKKRTGDETVFFHLTKALLELDTENEYRLLTDERDPAARALLRGRLGCIGRSTVKIIPLFTGNRFLWNLVAVPLYLWREQIDIYHTQYILPFFIPKRTQALTLVHDVSFRAYPEFISWSDRFFLTLLLPGSLARATRILAPSQFTKNEIMKYYHVPAKKISVIPNAPQDIFLQKANDDFETMKKKYVLPEKYVLYVGTLQPRKNIPFLLLAFALLVKRLPEVKLVIVGSRSARHVDPRIAEVIEKEKLESNVLFPGYIEEKDLPMIVAHAHTLVFPSLYEGFGIPILEAMSQAVPVIVTDIPSLREVGGAAVVYVRPGDLDDLSEKMYNFAIESEASNRSFFIEEGKRRVVLYSWQESARLLREVYQSM